MFEKHKAKKAEEQYKSQMEEWQSEHDELTAALQAATTKTGWLSSDIMLESGEAVFGDGRKHEPCGRPTRSGTLRRTISGVFHPCRVRGW